MTGINFNDDFSQKIDKSFSGFLDTTQRNSLFREALLLSIEDVYKNLDKQKDFDSINSIIRTNQVYKINNNKLYVKPIPIISVTAIILMFPLTIIVTRIPHNLITGDQVLLTEIAGTMSILNNTFYTVTVIDTVTFTIPVFNPTEIHTPNTGKISQHQSATLIPKLIPDYIHLLAVKFLYAQNTPAIRITDASNSQPIMITLNTRNNNIKTGEKITHSGILGNTNANGTFYVKKVGALKYQLFQDKEFMLPTAGNGAFTGVALLTKPIYTFAVPYYSSRKISGFDTPTIDNPAFERAENLIKAQPLDSVCLEATCDYIGNGIVDIISTDSAINLNDTYPEYFLYMVLDKAVHLLAAQVKDTELYQTSALELAQEK